MVGSSYIQQRNFSGFITIINCNGCPFVLKQKLFVPEQKGLIQDGAQENKFESENKRIKTSLFSDFKNNCCASSITSSVHGKSVFGVEVPFKIDLT